MRFLVAALVLAVLGAPAAAARPTIGTVSDLPPVHFVFVSPPSKTMTNDDLTKMLPAFRHEAERLLQDYDIKDVTIVQQLRLGLASIAVLDGRKADALRMVAEYRAAETKTQLKLLGGLATDLAAVMIDVPPERRCPVAAAHLTDLIANTDPSIIRDQLLGAYASFQTASMAYFASAAVGDIDPVARQRGWLDVLDALTVVRWTMTGRTLPQCRDELSGAARTWLDVPANGPVDIWQGRQPAPDAFTSAKPVVVAVWDAGYDETLFPGQLARDPAEPLDGRDNDGNGVTDDWNGPTYGIDLRPRTGSMMPPTHFLQNQLAVQMAYDKGELDLRYGLNTREAALYAQFARTAGTEDQANEFLASMENGNRTHGTACASEIADDAPYVRLYNIAALPWGRGEDKLEVPYDEATIARWAAVIDRIGPRIRGASVRVVSMSWGLTADEITQQLLDHGLERDPLRAKARGLVMRQTIADALHRLMSASPNTLFVVAAGNSDQAGDIQADAVKTFSVPNIIIVGATGTNGRPTAFTVFGESVSIYAQGEAVPLRWPGNIPLKESGTSMAAPLVARAAAQMFAVRPKLTGAQVRAGLLANASVEDDGMKLLYPARSVAWARSQ